MKTIPLLHSFVPSSYHEILGNSTLNIGVINGGKSANVVPEKAEMHCDFRLVPPHDPDKFGRYLSKQISSAMEHSEAEFTFEIQQSMPALQTKTENAFVKKFLTFLDNQTFTGLSYATDAAVLVPGAPKDLPFIIFGPGDPTAIHAANENVSIRELQISERIFTQFLSNLAIHAL